MATTPQDWRVTAGEQARRARTELECALDDSTDADSPVLSFADVLAHLWRAAQAAESAAGALVTAELRDGMSWDEVARTLGFATADDARRALTPAMAAGEQRLHDRLPRA
ncbi:MAG TPA: hypothetical protein VFR35_10815 [Actinoplanes sp.]|nr:hypothetical protein [Actinoplanes sp.]